MANEKTIIECLAPSVEEAIQKGLDELGLQADAVLVEVLDEGKKGLFKLASRMARVRLVVKGDQAEDERDVATPSKPAKHSAATQLDDTEDDYEDDADLDETLTVTRRTIAMLLEKMQIDANVQVGYGEPDERFDEIVLVNIEGNDLSYLIGHRSETINAIQYIASLIINKELNRWVTLRVDVQNYRNRRERELRKLARRMADQVIASGKKQYLEPMPANERRIIHIELRENPLVESESVGEDPYRKVTISPKN